MLFGRELPGFVGWWECSRTKDAINDREQPGNSLVLVLGIEFAQLYRRHPQKAAKLFHVSALADVLLQATVAAEGVAHQV